MRDTLNNRQPEQETKESYKSEYPNSTCNRHRDMTAGWRWRVAAEPQAGEAADQNAADLRD
jgi:hypothetical protein